MGVTEINSLKEEMCYCTKCELFKTRKNVVVGSGPWDASVLFIGEAPGKKEDEKGVPFIGRAGSVLDELLSSIELNRDDIFIANILKCRPENNSNPTEGQIKACTPFLNRQIALIKPKLICTLGTFSTNYVFSLYGLPEQKISSVHGKVFEPAKGIKILPLYHPAALIYNRKLRDDAFNDFKTIKALLKNTAQLTLV